VHLLTLNCLAAILLELAGAELQPLWHLDNASVTGKPEGRASGCAQQPSSCRAPAAQRINASHVVIPQRALHRDRAAV
jgi:hypothetical protein